MSHSPSRSPVTVAFTSDSDNEMNNSEAVLNDISKNLVDDILPPHGNLKNEDHVEEQIPAPVHVEPEESISDKAGDLLADLKHQGEHVLDELKDLAHQAQDKVEEWKEDSQDKGKDFGDELKEKAHDAVEDLKELAHKAEHKIDELKHDFKDENKAVLEELEQLKEKAEDTIEELKEEVQEDNKGVIQDLKEYAHKVEDKVDEYKHQFEEDNEGLLHDIQAAGHAAKDKAGEYVDYVKDKAEHVRETVSAKLDGEEVSLDHVKDLAADAYEASKDKIEEVKQHFTEASPEPEDFAAEEPIQAATFEPNSAEAAVILESVALPDDILPDEEPLAEKEQTLADTVPAPEEILEETVVVETFREPTPPVEIPQREPTPTPPPSPVKEPTPPPSPKDPSPAVVETVQEYVVVPQIITVDTTATSQVTHETPEAAPAPASQGDVVTKPAAEPITEAAKPDDANRQTLGRRLQNAVGNARQRCSIL